ncbi:hypothetical protein [Mucilaginibacter polytrichastri]|uniref:hypothetical protein n=1 Tax=Mucilaginibacter polytrichastri TaxID=1302689 RepID=UPI0008EF6274|nr:hypothetical protein [Mucilaginibacter polytrichastri]SFT16376.1 hypothetical protein SAMN04487890_113114 [Mucilaginibacter polytrichastri]
MAITARPGQFTSCNTRLSPLLRQLWWSIQSKTQMMDPFHAYQLKFNKVEREYLTKDELARIEARKFNIIRLLKIPQIFYTVLLCGSQGKKQLNIEHLRRYLSTPCVHFALF